MQEENVIFLTRRFLCSLMCGDCIPQFHVRLFEANIKFQFATGGNWTSSKRHTSLSTIVFGSLFSLRLVFSNFSLQTKPNQTKQNVTFDRKS